MLHSASLFIHSRKTDRIKCMPCVHMLVWFYAETRKKKNLDHFCIEVFFELLATTKLQYRVWNIPQQSYGTQNPSLARSVRKLKSIGKWILGLPPNETCLAKKNNVLSEHSSGVAYHPYACNNCIFRIIYHSFKAARDISIKSVYKWNALHLPNYQKASLFLRISSLWLCCKTH